MTAGDPNFRFRGRWQSEHRCTNNPSPRFCCSFNFPEVGNAAANLLCACKCSAPAAENQASKRIADIANFVFKVDLPYT